jgi:N utilization substance protein A
VIQRIEAKQVYINLGRTEAILPPNEQTAGERYRIGQRLRVYVVEVARTPKGPKVMVSRSHPHLLRRLFELEIPEVFNGIVEIKSISREAGFRSKVAVAARQEGIDPVGCCVGLRGIRIQNIVNELNGEKIDVVAWNKDIPVFIANALSPAQVLSVELNNDIGTVTVPDKHLSLAIGKDGQNARLAAKLTGWRIDIKSASVAEAEKAAKVAAEVAAGRGKEEEVVEAAAPAKPEVAPAPVAAAAEHQVAEPVTAAVEQPAAAEEEAPVEVAAEAEPVEEAEEVKKEEAEAATVLSSTFIPRRIIQPREAGKTQIRFAEDIFSNRPGRSEDKPRKKKKKFSHSTYKPASNTNVNLKGGQPEIDSDDES